LGSETIKGQRVRRAGLGGSSYASSGVSLILPPTSGQFERSGFSSTRHREVIRDFACRETEKIFDGTRSRKLPPDIQTTARRKRKY
jgi:hypothetical protein